MSKLTLNEVKKQLINDIMRCDGLAVLVSSSPSSDPDIADISVRFAGESVADIADLVARLVISLGRMTRDTVDPPADNVSDFSIGLAAVCAAYDLMSREEVLLNPHLH